MTTKEEFIARFNEPLYRQNLEGEWWKRVRAHVHGDEIQVNMWHGHLAALTPHHSDPNDGFMKLFPWKQQEQEWNPEIFDIHPKVVRWNRLSQVIWQIQHIWMADPDSLTAGKPEVSIEFGFDRYQLRIYGFIFRLPTEAEVRAVDPEPEEE